MTASEQIVFLELRVNEKEFCVENFKNNSELLIDFTLEFETTRHLK